MRTLLKQYHLIAEEIAGWAEEPPDIEEIEAAVSDLHTLTTAMEEIVDLLYRSPTTGGAGVVVE